MSTLSDHSIRHFMKAGRLIIEPLADGALQPASVDLTLGSGLLVFTGALMDPTVDMSRFWRDVDCENGAWLLKPGALYLGVTREQITLPPDVAGELFGISSLGRCGIQIHSTAGWVDAGYSGHLTVEVTVQAAPTLLRPGQRIGQLVLHRMTTIAERPYSGKYAGDVVPTPSRFHQEAARDGHA